MGYLSQKIEEYENKVITKIENSESFKNASPKTRSILAFVALFIVAILIFLLFYFVL